MRYLAFLAGMFGTLLIGIKLNQSVFGLNTTVEEGGGFLLYMFGAVVASALVGGLCSTLVGQALDRFFGDCDE